MTREVAFRWVAGKCCPYCGGAVQWLTEERLDPHSPTGWSTYKTAIKQRCDRPIDPLDKPVSTVVGRQGHQEICKTQYEHVWDVQCDECGIMLSSGNLVPNEPKEYPPGYWKEGR